VEVMSPFDIVKHLVEKTDLEVEFKHYTPFVINRAMSYDTGTLFFADILNRCSGLTKQMQYDMYFYGMPKGKQKFSKWHKPDKAKDKYLSIIRELYECNETTAHKYYRLMDNATREQLLTLKGGT
jgi:hypothetical protein